jgi:hypothetical protein
MVGRRHHGALVPELKGREAMTMRNGREPDGRDRAGDGVAATPPTDIDLIPHGTLVGMFLAALAGQDRRPDPQSMVFTVAVHGRTLRCGLDGVSKEPAAVIPHLLCALHALGGEHGVDLLGEVTRLVQRALRRRERSGPPTVRVRLDRMDTN